MPPTENNNCPDGVKSNLRFWVVNHFVLLGMGLSLAYTFIRESVYRNFIISIEVDSTHLRCDLMYNSCLMASLIIKVTINQKLLPFILKELL